jgi:hypothetical protein
MEEARAVLARLERIEALDREGARPEAVLAELRHLVREAEDWARLERDERALAAARALTLERGIPATVGASVAAAPSCR